MFVFSLYRASSTNMYKIIISGFYSNRNVRMLTERTDCTAEKFIYFGLDKFKK